MRTSGWIAGILCAALVFPGCLKIPQESIHIQRYAIEPVGDFSIAGTTLNLSIRVLPFAADAVYQGNRIVYQNRYGETNYYFYHRWAAPVELQFSNLLSANLMRWGFFGGGVWQSDKGILPDYEMEGRLNALYAVNQKSDSRAMLEITVNIFYLNPTTLGKELVFQKQYAMRAPRDNESVASFIQAVNNLCGLWLQQLRNDLGPFFIQDNAKRNPKTK
jgi:ABC-type uncharacterized transport system auxiliary subunit